jgi:hypothetical protein
VCCATISYIDGPAGRIHASGVLEPNRKNEGTYDASEYQISPLTTHAQLQTQNTKIDPGKSLATCNLSPTLHTRTESQFLAVGGTYHLHTVYVLIASSNIKSKGIDDLPPGHPARPKLVQPTGDGVQPAGPVIDRVRPEAVAA